MSEAEIDRLIKRAAREAVDLAMEEFDVRWATYFENQDAYIDKKLEPLQQIKADVQELKMEMRTFKAALTATNKQVQNHEHRITHLEQRLV